MQVDDWMQLIGTSERGHRDYAPRVDGTIPAELRGALYRNGPGLFERGGHRLDHVLDGDGLVQRLSFDDGRVHYRNAFVQTRKLVSERAAGRFLYGTWSTRLPGGFWRNLGGGASHSQAGVTVLPVHGKLIARDEVEPSYEIDPRTLDTIADRAVLEDDDGVRFKAHSKLDPDTGEWIICGVEFGRRMRFHVAAFEPRFALKTHFSFESPRQVYIHDYFVSKHHVVFILHPCKFSPWLFLAGFRSFIECLRWDREAGNLIAVVPRAGGKARFFDAPSAFVWHTLNAFDSGGTIICDFVGYDEPDHFLGSSAYARTIMRGLVGNARAPGKLRRYRIDLASKTAAQEILCEVDHEYPMLDWRSGMRRHRYGFFCSGGRIAFHSGLKRVDYETGAESTFDFGLGTQVGEPVFVPRDGTREGRGWLVAQCLDAESRKSFFALFDAERIEDGPLARIWLTHHVPISFHGSWVS